MSDTADWPAVLALAGRGALPFSPLHREPLYLHALKALAASGASTVVVSVEPADRDRVAREVHRTGLVVEVRDGTTWWDAVRQAPGRGVLVHDPLCPLVSADFLRDVRRGAAARPAVSLLAYRPVTDTVKTVVEERIQGTIDRETLAALVSPAVLSPRVVAASVAAGEQPPVDDFAALSGWLRERGAVELVRAPSMARRVDDASAVNLLECVDELARRVRREPGPSGAVSGAAGPGTRAGT